MTAICVAGPRFSFVASIFGLHDACFAYLLTILQVLRGSIYFASQACCTCSIWALKWCPCFQLLLASIHRHLLSPHLIPLTQFHASVAESQLQTHTRNANLHLPGAHQWSRMRASRVVPTLAATASRHTFAVFFSNVSVTSVCLLNPLTTWQHACRSMGPSHQAYLAQATECR